MKLTLKKVIFFVMSIFLMSQALAGEYIAPNPYKDPQQAFNYVYDLCNKQHRDDGWATYMLGSYYDRGYGTKQNVVQAYVWYKTAVVDQKYKPAYLPFNHIKKKLTALQIKQGDKIYLSHRDKEVQDLFQTLKDMNK